MVDRTQDEMYRATIAAYRRTVAAQELADTLGYEGLEEDLFNLAIELQHLAGTIYDGRQLRRRRGANASQPELPFGASAKGSPRDDTRQV